MGDLPLPEVDPPLLLQRGHIMVHGDNPERSGMEDPEDFIRKELAEWARWEPDVIVNEGEEQEGGGSPSRERRPSINAEDPEVAANDPKTHAAKERNFAMVRANTSLSSKKSEHQRLLLVARRCCGRRRGSTRCRSAS